jgi:hypothetical protein
MFNRIIVDNSILEIEKTFNHYSDTRSLINEQINRFYNNKSHKLRKKTTVKKQHTHTFRYR